MDEQFLNKCLPYGAQNKGQFLPYLINPHSCIRVGNKILAFMLQAHFFREIDLDSFESQAIFIKEKMGDIIFSASSIGIVNEKEIFLTINSLQERADIYNGIKKEMGFQFLRYDVEMHKFEYEQEIKEGLIDNMHQVGYSSERFLVSLDMNISLDIDINKIPNLDSIEMRNVYQHATFPNGKIFLWDMKEKKNYLLSRRYVHRHMLNLI